ncbi:MAG TPA: class I SAM-dependent methyltransferase [Oculatellaceae cyanobacterium]|jgi:ubiquinone/menaquinone biosynthesis C-methylase UbiE
MPSAIEYCTENQLVATGTEEIPLPRAPFEAVVQRFLHREVELGSTEYEAILEKNWQKIKNIEPSKPDSWKERLLAQLFKTRSAVYKIWNQQWKENLRLREAFFSPDLAPTPYLWGQRLLMMTNAAGVLTRILISKQIIEALQPRNIVEIGCGDGLNLIFLASMFPNIQFTGIELTPQGVQTARTFQAQHVRLPEYMVCQFPEWITDRIAFKNITFKQGNATKLTEKDNGFDLVLTCVALEQMEAFRHQALSEISRIAKRWAVMTEPFRNFNSSGPSQIYIEKYNYFQGAIQDLPSYGLEPILHCNDLPQKLNLRAGTVVCRKVR